MQQKLWLELCGLLCECSFCWVHFSALHSLYLPIYLDMYLQERGMLAQKCYYLNDTHPSALIIPLIRPISKTNICRTFFKHQSHSPQSSCWIFHPQSRDSVSRAVHTICLLSSVWGALWTKRNTRSAVWVSNSIEATGWNRRDVFVFQPPSHVRLCDAVLEVMRGQLRDSLSWKLRCSVFTWASAQAQIAFCLQLDTCCKE